MFVTITYFEDLFDNSRPYRDGDVFPHPDCAYKVTDARFSELSSERNKQHKPLIKWVEEVKEELNDSKPNLTRTDIARMNKAQLVTEAEKVGIDTEDKSGAELKELLVKHYGL
jgi:hypothetical protein